MRILLVGKERRFCQLVKKVLQGEEDFLVVSQTVTTAAAVQQARNADAVLVDGQWPLQEMLDLTRSLLSENSDIKVVLVCGEENPEVILASVEAGAAGYVLREEIETKLVEQMRAVRQEQALVSPQMAAHLISRLALLNGRVKTNRHQDKISHVGLLTARQHEILQLLADQLSNPEIGRLLQITEGTVKNHVHFILKKLEVSTRQQAAAVYTAWKQLGEVGAITG